MVGSEKAAVPKRGESKMTAKFLTWATGRLAVPFVKEREQI